MKEKWSEMSKQKKIEAITIIALGLVAAVYAVLDWTGKWPNNTSLLALAVMSAYEAVVGWKENRKMAILEVVVAVIFLLGYFTGN